MREARLTLTSMKVGQTCSSSIYMRLPTPCAASCTLVHGKYTPAHRPPTAIAPAASASARPRPAPLTEVPPVSPLSVSDCSRASSVGRLRERPAPPPARGAAPSAAAASSRSPSSTDGRCANPGCGAKCTPPSVRRGGCACKFAARVGETKTPPEPPAPAPAPPPYPFAFEAVAALPAAVGLARIEAITGQTKPETRVCANGTSITTHIDAMCAYT